MRKPTKKTKSGPKAKSGKSEIRFLHKSTCTSCRQARGFLEQRGAQLTEQREAGRLGLGSLVDHGASIGGFVGAWTTLMRVSVPPGRRRTRWKDRADDPELERELIEELDRRRRAREEDRQRRAQERRSRWVIWLFVLLTAAAAVAIGYGALEVARSLFG